MELRAVPDASLFSLRLSFYSGHSSFSMYSLLFVAVSTGVVGGGGHMLPSVRPPLSHAARSLGQPLCRQVQGRRDAHVCQARLDGFRVCPSLRGHRRAGGTGQLQSGDHGDRESPREAGLSLQRPMTSSRVLMGSARARPLGHKAAREVPTGPTRNPGRGLEPSACVFLGAVPFLGCGRGRLWLSGHAGRCCGFSLSRLCFPPLPETLPRGVWWDQSGVARGLGLLQVWLSL